MIQQLMAYFSTAFSTPSAPAFGAALVWGLLSVFLSPCHLGAIPLIVGYVNNGSRPGRRRALFLSFLFALGLLVMLALVGLVTSSAGRLIGDVGSAVTIITSLLIIACGLWLMDLPPFSGINFSFNVKTGRRGAGGALSLGLMYGIVLGPCSFAFLAPMLLYIFSAGTGGTGFGLALMLFYALGHTAAIVSAGTFGDLLHRILQKKGNGLGSVWFKRGLGAVVVLVGIFQII